ALIQWKAITAQDEVLALLELAQIEPDTFSTEEWQALSINSGAGRSVKHANFADNTRLHSLQQNLPASLTPLIGREKVVAQLRELVGDAEVRLVTLLGPGGCGKTRLAQQLASELKEAFADGVWFVPLASIGNAILVPQSIMQGLHIRPTLAMSDMQTLIAYLQNKQLLLILDNFEHVERAAPVVNELLAAAPGLKVLVTSRKVLHLYGERVFNVPSLDYPAYLASHVALDREELLQYSAVKLFVERARALVSDFALTSENAASITQICARVDGLPLALELAAARVKVLPPEQLLVRLEEARLSLLTGGARDVPDRQQTLRNTIKWSYDLLSPVEQAWFARLGVFSGGCSLEAVEAMMRVLGNADEPARQEDTDDTIFPLDLLVRLMDNCLLVRLPVTGGQARFTLLETLREYALEQLKARGEYKRLRDWHACYYLSVAEAAEIELRGLQQIMWRTRLVAERDNFRWALWWSLRRANVSASAIIGSIDCRTYGIVDETRVTRKAVENEAASPGTMLSTGLLTVDVALRLASALRPYWEWQGHLIEGHRWFNAALGIELAEDAGKTTLAARAKALCEVSRLACLQNDQDKAIELAEASIMLWRQLDNPEGLATALLQRGWAAHALGEYQQAKGCYEEGLHLLSSTGNVWLR
ncbi:MAG TPA: NB-ARC domain-containing protein, partial [Ktedonobacteraceae bacterium]|nr:NB-ARC domain-containing protein [Ktedonobacteraceae bacterium]